MFPIIRLTIPLTTTNNQETIRLNIGPTHTVARITSLRTQEVIFPLLGIHEPGIVTESFRIRSFETNQLNDFITQIIQRLRNSIPNGVNTPISYSVERTWAV